MAPRSQKNKHTSKESVKNDKSDDDLLVISRKELRSLIREIFDESLNEINKKLASTDEVSDVSPVSSSDKEESSSDKKALSDLESMSAAEVKKLADQKAADEKVTIRISGKRKTPTKKDNINFLLQDAPKKKPKEKREIVYDAQRKLYTWGKYATNEDGDVYGRVLKTGKVCPLTSEENAKLLKEKIPLAAVKPNQNAVNKYRKSCEKEESDVSDVSDSSVSDSDEISSDSD
jgi:hypothetical protein